MQQDNSEQPSEARTGRQTEPKTWWSKATLVGAVIALVMLLLAAAGYRLHIWSLGGAFLVLGGAVVLSLFGVLGGVVGVLVALRKKLDADKPALYMGTLIAALILGYMGMQFNAARSVPPIHDISTDPADPPQFEKVVELRDDKTNSLVYDREMLEPLQAEAYPWVETLETSYRVAESYQRALEVLQEMGLEIVQADPERGHIEAVATSLWFGFKDDLVVRMRASSQGTKIDVRSASRVGESDLGKNAQRIGVFLEAMRSEG